jgi:hypothetical protein
MISDTSTDADRTTRAHATAAARDGHRLLVALGGFVVAAL